jgi:bacterioferritin-associated ferredoxin
MIVCSCNGFSDADVRRVCCGEGGQCAKRVAEVYAHLDCRAECGTCTRTVLGLMRAADSADTPRHAPKEPAHCADCPRDMI